MDFGIKELTMTDTMKNQATDIDNVAMTFESI